MKRASFGVATLSALVFVVIFMMAIGRVPAGLQTQQPGSALGGVSSDERLAKAGELISSGLEQRNIPSVSIAVSRKGLVIWEQSFGWADREKRIKASPGTVYSLASTTKPMIATGLLALVPTDNQRMHFILPYRVSLKRTSSPSARFRPENAKRVRMFPEFVEGHEFKF